MTRASVPGPTSTTRQLLLAVALLSLAVPAAARADDAALGVRAAAMARDGRCQDALALLDSAGRSDAGLALLRGKCQLELRRYPDAVASLEEAKRLDPSRTDVDLPLAMARFHQGDLDGARTALDAAAPTRATGPSTTCTGGSCCSRPRSPSRPPPRWSAPAT